MLNRIDSTSFGGKISIISYKDITPLHTITIDTSLVDDRLIKLTADSICKVKTTASQPIKDKMAEAFAKLIEMITGVKLKNLERAKKMSIIDNRIIFTDKIPQNSGESVIIRFDDRI